MNKDSTAGGVRIEQNVSGNLMKDVFIPNEVQSSLEEVELEPSLEPFYQKFRKGEL